MKIRIGSMHGKVYDFDGVKEVRITQNRIDFNYNIKFENENRNEMIVGTRNDHVVIRIEKDGEGPDEKRRCADDIK